MLTNSIHSTESVLLRSYTPARHGYPALTRMIMSIQIAVPFPFRRANGDYYMIYLVTDEYRTIVFIKQKYRTKGILAPFTFL